MIKFCIQKTVADFSRLNNQPSTICFGVYYKHIQMTITINIYYKKNAQFLKIERFIGSVNEKLTFYLLLAKSLIIAAKNLAASPPVTAR